MGARKRMAQTKAAVLSLLVDAYQKRDRVGLITFGGLERPAGAAADAERPRRRPALERSARRRHDAARPRPGAGRAESIASARRREPGVAPLVVLLTDGRGNVALQPGGNPEADALALARQLAQAGVAGLVIDTETGPVRLGMARRARQGLGRRVPSRSTTSAAGACPRPSAAPCWRGMTVVERCQPSR